MTDQTGHILVVDDDMMARMEASQCAKLQGHMVTMADGGARALELLRSQSFDLVLLDLMMPDVDGFEVLRQMQADEKLRGIPVIVVSGADETDSIARCIEMGAVGHLAKPVDPGLLGTRVSAALIEKNG
jgi:CheY-like chemotaxis protein